MLHVNRKTNAIAVHLELTTVLTLVLCKLISPPTVSGVATLGHAGACALATRGRAPPVQR